MTYEAAIRLLYDTAPLFQQQGTTAYKTGLENTNLLDEHFSHPHRNYLTIHVGGTNGKGSTAHTLASILQVAGLKVGLYTSPHLVDFRERIRVNGEKITKKYVAEFIETEKDFFLPLHPSFFEVTTALAFKYFSDKAVDIAVVEVGLGGRFDCTNVIRPILSVITNISFDHTQLLGNTIPEIAQQKSGIIKSGVPAIIGEADKETRPVFEETANAADTTIFFAEDLPEVVHNKIDTSNRLILHTRSFGELVFDLSGDCQVKNANTILCALNVLKHGQLKEYLTPKNIKEGFASVCKRTGLMGRWQTVRLLPPVVCDTGHNSGGWLYLSEKLREISCNRKLKVVFGMAGDKDFKNILSLLPHNAYYYWTKASVRRGLDPQILEETGRKLGLRGEICTDVASAAKKAIENSIAEDFVFIGGSSFVVADFLTWAQESTDFPMLRK